MAVTIYTIITINFLHSMSIELTSEEGDVTHPLKKKKDHGRQSQQSSLTEFLNEMRLELGRVRALAQKKVFFFF